MPSLSVEDFLTAGPDMERAQYKILAGLRAVKEDFARTIIYPHLSDLIELHASLSRLRSQLDEIRGALPTEIASIDLEKNEVVHREQARDFGPMGHLGELIEWAIPRLRETIEEGRTIFEFVDSSLRLEEVGILPNYTEEGYLMVPDGEANELCVFRYALSIVTRADERYRGLKTTIAQTAARPACRSPAAHQADADPRAAGSPESRHVLRGRRYRIPVRGHRHADRQAEADAAPVCPRRFRLTRFIRPARI